MGKKSKPDYESINRQQDVANKESIRNQNYANRPTRNTPWGTESWTQTGGIDPSTGKPITNWTQNTNLSENQQAIFNAEEATTLGKRQLGQSLVGRMQNEFGQPMDWGNLTAMGANPESRYTNVQQGPEAQWTNSEIGDPYATRQRAEDAVYDQAMSRLGPRQEAQSEALEVKMRNQGLGPEDAAWQAQVARQDDSFTDQDQQTMWNANQAGQAESAQMFGQQLGRTQMQMGANNQNFGQSMQMNQNQFNQNLGANQANYSQDMSGSTYANQMRQQQMAEAMQRRGFSLNEINALMSGQQVGMPTMPTFNASNAAAPVDYVGAAMHEQSINQANNPTSALIGAGATMAGAYLGGPAMAAGAATGRKGGTPL